MSGYKRKKRSKHHASLREDDDDAIDTVTHTDIEVITRSGTVKKKRVKVPFRVLEPDKETSPQPPISFEYNNTSYVPLESDPAPGPTPEANKRKVRVILVM
jgi:hypothetical protein